MEEMEKMRMSFMPSSSFRRLLVTSLFVPALVVTACSSGQQAAPKPEPPAGTLLAKVKPGMSDTEVKLAVGAPARTREYITGKVWIPWYYGSDTSRSAWTYPGQGEVVFSRNRYSGNLKVIRVDYDPKQQ